MSGSSLWTEEETIRLKRLYSTRVSFDEIKKAFPNRSHNAIRIKASRLGIRRPMDSSPVINSNNVLRLSNGAGNLEDFIFKCSGCGTWMLVNIDEENQTRTIICRQCQTICRYVV